MLNSNHMCACKDTCVIHLQLLVFDRIIEMLDLHTCCSSQILLQTAQYNTHVSECCCCKILKYHKLFIALFEAIKVQFELFYRQVFDPLLVSGVFECAYRRGQARSFS